MSKKDFDAIIVGSGPNGLSAAITLQKFGLSVLVVEGKETIGGGMRTAELTLPGFKHDVCSAIHPMAIASPFFADLPLNKHGLELVYAPIEAAHPFDDGTAAALYRSVEKTAKSLGKDEEAYKKLIGSAVESWPRIVKDVLGPLTFPKHPLLMAQFGLDALQPASWIAKKFQTEKAKGLWGGMTAHSIQPLTNWSSAAIGIVLSAVGHLHGWPIPKGGSQSIANALASYFISMGGEIETNHWIKSIDQLPSSTAVL
ncbi:MAG: fumarate reductase/succinate dehydrogenase flavoprotein domain protein, partial [Daejeonella sp.]|nr:fumarate reductase/succinate dehydrogenase flavoprotein domain protein [Daejeonella sp.]